MENNAEEIDIVNIIKFSLQNIKTVLFFVLVGIIASVATIYFIPKEYKAEAILNIGQSGEGDFIQDVNKLASQVDYSFTVKYPKMTADVVSLGILKITDRSAIREEAIKNVLEASVTIVQQDEEYKKSVQSSITRLQAISDALKAQGQQTGSIDLRIFDMQERLNGLASSKLSGDVKVSEDGLNYILVFVIGIILGILTGLVYAGLSEWVKKNKKKLLF